MSHNTSFTSEGITGCVYTGGHASSQTPQSPLKPACATPCRASCLACLTHAQRTVLSAHPPGASSPQVPAPSTQLPLQCPWCRGEPLLSPRVPNHGQEQRRAVVLPAPASPVLPWMAVHPLLWTISSWALNTPVCVQESGWSLARAKSSAVTPQEQHWTTPAEKGLSLETQQCPSLWHSYCKGKVVVVLAQHLGLKNYLFTLEEIREGHGLYNQRKEWGWLIALANNRGKKSALLFKEENEHCSKHADNPHQTQIWFLCVNVWSSCNLYGSCSSFKWM